MRVPHQLAWAPPEAWRAKLGSCLLMGMLGNEARLARFLRVTPRLFLRGLLSPVGTDRVPLPRRGRRPVEAEKVLGQSWSCLAPESPFGNWLFGELRESKGDSLSSLRMETVWMGSVEMFSFWPRCW